MAPRPINLSTSSEPSLPRCPDCNSVKLTFDSTRGEVSCGHCGVVVEESYIDQSAEWRAYSKEQHVKRARTGTPKNLLTYDQYGTLIDYSNKDIFGNSLSPEKASQSKRPKDGASFRISSSVSSFTGFSEPMSHSGDWLSR